MAIATILSFRLNGIMTYKYDTDHANRCMKSSVFQANAKLLQQRKRYVGFVTPEMKKRMQKAITLLIQSTPYKYQQHPVSGRIVCHKLSFITLTTPAHEKSHDAKYCHKHLLEPMLRELRRKHGMKSYIWKAEYQSNGQIHYHLTTEIMINHTTLRERWNKLLNENGMLDQFFSENGHRNPNSTDIHAVYKINNLEAYLVKYICKEYQNEEKLTGKVWDCSKNLKQGTYFKTELDYSTHQLIRKLQKTGEVITHYFEKAIYLDFKTSDYYSFFKNSIKQDFFKHLKNLQQWTQTTKTQTLTTPTALRDKVTPAQGITDSAKMIYTRKLGKHSDGWKRIIRNLSRQQLQLTYPCYLT